MRLPTLLVIALLAGCTQPPEALEDTAGPDPVLGEDPEPVLGTPSGPPHASSTTTSGTTAEDGNKTHAAPNPPGPMHWEGEGWLVGAPPVPPLFSGCQSPFANCVGHAFNVYGTFDLEVTLTWDLSINDFDVYLVRRDGDNHTHVSSDPYAVGDAPTTEEILRYEDLPPGAYGLWVAMHHGPRAGYELDAIFS